MGKFLVVDDSRLGRMMIQQVLERSGHTTLVAEDGRKALQMVEEHPVDGIFLDMLMPEMDGQEFLEKLNEGDLGIPVIVVSADIQTTTQEKCYALGVKHFLTKPVKAAELLTQVDRLLNG